MFTGYPGPPWFTHQIRLQGTPCTGVKINTMVTSVHIGPFRCGQTALGSANAQGPRGRIHTRWCPRSRTRSVGVHITPISLWFLLVIYLQYSWAYKPTFHHWGAPPCRIHGIHWEEIGGAYQKKRPKNKASVREHPQKIWPYVVQYLHFRILKFPIMLHLDCLGNRKSMIQQDLTMKKLHDIRWVQDIPYRILFLKLYYTLFRMEYNANDIDV